MLRRFSIVVVLLIAPSTDSDCAEPSVPEIVAKYERAMAKFSSYRAKCVDITTGSPNSGSTSYVERFETELIRDSDERFHEKSTLSIDGNSGGKVAKTRARSEVSIIGKDSTNVVWRDPKRVRDFFIMAKLGVAGSVNTESGEFRQNSIYSAFCNIFFAYNMFNQYETPFVELFRDKSTTAQLETLSGKSTVRLNCKTKWGTATVWLDPAREYLPIRIALTKGLDDWLSRDKPVSSFPASSLNFAPKGQIIIGHEMTHDIDYGPGNTIGPNLSIRNIRISRYKNGEETKYVTESKVTELVLNPDFRSGKAFEIQTPIPDGTPVQVEEEPNILYEWQKGRVVKVGVNENYVAPVVVPGTPWWRWPLAVIVVVCVLFGLWRGNAVLRKG